MTENEAELAAAYISDSFPEVHAEAIDPTLFLAWHMCEPAGVSSRSPSDSRSADCGRAYRGLTPPDSYSP